MDNRINANVLLGNKVLNKLRQYSFLPTPEYKGQIIVAGGAVLAAIVEELNIEGVNAVYNDIDLFIDYSKSKEYFEYIARQRTKVRTSENGVFGYFRGAYGEIVASKSCKYQVKYSNRDGMLNKVFVEYYRPYNTKIRVIEEDIKQLVSSFDFTSVQVGVDLYTGILYGTDDFWDFIANKEFKIGNLNTPSHTLIRLLHKLKTIGPGVYANKEKLINECLIGIDKSQSKHKYHSDIDIPSNFGDVTLKKALDPLIKEELLSYVNIVREECILGGYQTYKFLTKNFDHIEQLENKLDIRYRNANYIFRIPMSELIPLSNLAEYGRKSDKKFFKEIVSSQKDFKNMKELIDYQPSFFINQQKKDMNVAKRINKFLEHDLVDKVYYMGLDLTYDLANKSKKVVKEYGEIFYGFMEGYYNGFDNFDKLKKEFVEYYQEGEKVLIEPIFREEKIGRYQLKQLVTRNELKVEGSVMRHCVGGYEHSVVHKSSIILSIRCMEDKMKSMTVELDAISKDYNEFFIVQNRKYRNAEPTQEEKDVAWELLNKAKPEDVIIHEKRPSTKQDHPYIDFDDDEIPF